MATRQLTVEEAAAYLTVSPVTIRRRIKKGDLVATKEPTAQGFVYRVTVEVPDAVAADVSAPDGSAPPDQATPQPGDQRLLVELRGQVDYLKGELETRKAEHDRDRDGWRDELQRVHTLMAQQGQTIQQQGQTIQALAQRVEALPAASHQITPDTEEQIKHLYLSQAVSPLSTALLALLVPFGIATWGYFAQGRGGSVLAGIRTGALLLTVIAVAYLVVLGVPRIRAHREQQVANGTYTVEELRHQSALAAIRSYPRPERYVYAGLVLVAAVMAIAEFVAVLVRYW